MAWLKLIRWKNLLIIFATQMLAWYCVILPLKPETLNLRNFICLSISTLLIAAAGYIINDYFDVKIDAINRPEKMVLGKQIPAKQAIIAHTALNIIALLLAAYIAAGAHHYHWLAVQLICTLLLWFYSTHFKRQFMIGNVVIAILTSLTIIVLIVYEPKVLFHLPDPNCPKGPDPDIKGMPFLVLCIYAYFSFILTWMREIVKDMEDFKGDLEEGCMTMPIKWGLKASVRFTLILSLLAVIPLGIASIFLNDIHFEVLSLYILISIIVPLVIWSVFLPRNASTEHYQRASRGLKLIMVLGIISLGIYYFQTTLFNGA